MQGKVAPPVGEILTVSAGSKRDTIRDFGVGPPVAEVGPLGVAAVFRPPAPSHLEGARARRVPGRLLAMASADTPMKGVATLLEAVAKLRTERSVELVLVTRPSPGGRTEQLIERLGLEDCV